MKTVWKVLLWVAGVWAVILIAVQVALSPSVLTRLANLFANEYVDADVSFGEVRLSVFRSFPYLNIGFTDFSLTYPSDRYAAVEDTTYYMMRQGRGPGADTLASVRRMFASVDVAALAAGTVRVPSLVLDRPRIFAKNYADGRKNWDVFIAGGSKDKDPADSLAEKEPMKFALGRIVLRGHPHVVYSSPADTLFAMADFTRMRFNGRLAAGDDELVRPDAADVKARRRYTRDSIRQERRRRRSRIGLTVDSMLVAGRLPSDTLAMRLDRMGIIAHSGHIDLDASATAWLASAHYGRIGLPVDISAEVGFPKDSVFALDIIDLKASVADLPLKASADLRFGDRLRISGSASIDECRVSDVLGHFRRSSFKLAGNIETDAKVSLSADFDGFLDPAEGVFPDIDARLSIPHSTIGNRMFDLRHEIALDGELHGRGGKMDLQLADFHVKGKALHIDVSGSASDLLGGDPLVDADASVRISLDTLSQFMKRRSGVELSGDLDASVRGKARISHLDPYQLAQADISGRLRSGGLKVISDSLRLTTDSLDIWLGAVGNTRDSSVAQGERMLAMTAYVDTAYLSMKDRMRVVGRNISLKAQNAAAVLDRTDSSRFYPFGGRLDIGFLSLVGADTTFVAVSNSGSIFKISPKSGAPDVPVLTLDSSNKGVFMRGPVNRIFVRNLDLDAVAAMNSIERRRRSRAFADSLMRRYPDVPPDSLFARFRRTRGSRPLPEWLSEEDFRKRDISLNLGDSVTRYLRDWDFDGSLSVGSAGVITPYFPLRNRLTDIKASFNNNEIRFDSFNLASGRSQLSLSGDLRGLRSMLRGQGFLRLDMEVSSDSLNVNELLGAWQLGSGYEPENLSATALDIADEEYQEMVTVDSLETSEVPAPALIVVPGNITADLRLKAADVTYSNLKIDTLTTDIAVRERCVQLTNTVARTDVGDIEFEGFYSTRTKRDLQTGFDLQLKDITAEKVIEMMPAVDSVMSMLKSFRGLLNCTVSATASMDTTMTILTPSINGVIRISGDDLTLSESTAFNEIARKLMFKDRTGGHVDHMSVEGLISDNKIEVFPFVLSVDRYTLAMSGVQNLDASFKYHVSVIQSPLPFRVGIDLSGTFDDFRFRIGKPKYRSVDVPVFSEVIDETRINLRESIQDIFRRGVDNAIRENRRNRFIEQRRRELGYKAAVDQQLDSLSASEQASLDSLSAAEASGTAGPSGTE